MSHAGFTDFQRNTKSGNVRPRPVLVAGVVMAAPASSADKVRVRALGDASGFYLGEASWPKPAPPKELPAEGDECLVGIDNRGRPYIIAWWEPGW